MGALLPSLHTVLLDSAPQYLENSRSCLILGPDHLGGFEDFGERTGVLESDQPVFESLLSHLLVVQPEAKELPSSP